MSLQQNSFLYRAGYSQNEQPYKLLPFRFITLNPTDLLVVNEVGEFYFVDGNTLTALASHTLDPQSQIYAELKAKHFLVDREEDALLDVLVTKYRTKKSFLAGFTKLHTFVVTLRCDHSCLYCQVSRQSVDKIKFDMSEETAKKSVDLMFCSPSRNITVEIQGGEPLLNFKLIQFLVEYIEEKNQSHQKNIDITITSNLSTLTDEILTYLKAHGIDLSTSLDGPEFIHNQNRPNGNHSSYALTIANIKRARAVLGHDQVNALMTTTRVTLQHPHAVVDEYVQQGFSSIFLRSVSPYGFATRTKNEIGYTMDEFVAFYKKAFDHIVEINRQGTHLAEIYAQLLLTKILTPFPTRYVDLQSPTGVGFGVVVYNYDGNVYASDESRMLAEVQDYTFRLGNVREHTYQELYSSKAMRAIAAASCVETLPGCAECAFQPYCGADPVYHHATQGNVFGHRPTSGHCLKNMEILKFLFKKLQTRDPALMRIFFDWLGNRRVQELPVACSIAEAPLEQTA